MDDSQFHTALRKASAAAAAFASNLGNVLKGAATAAIVSVTVAAVAMAGALASAMKRAFELGGVFADMSKQTGASVKSLTILHKALDLSGVGGDKLAGVLNKLQKAVAGGSDEFGKLGLNLDQLQKLSPDQQLIKVGDAIAAIQDPAQRTAAAMAIFGKSGGEMLKFFGGGDLEAATKLLGSMPEILEKNADMFDDIGDKVESISSKWDAFAVGIASKLAPVLNPILDKILAVDTAAFGQSLGADIANAFSGESAASGITRLAGNFVSVMTAAAISVGQIILSSITSAFQEPLIAAQAKIEFLAAKMLRLTGQDRSVDVDAINKDIKRDYDRQQFFGETTRAGGFLQDQIDKKRAMRDEAIASGNVAETEDQIKQRIRDTGGAKIGLGSGKTAEEIMEAALDRINRAATATFPQAAATVKNEIRQSDPTSFIGPPMAPEFVGPPMAAKGQGTAWSALQGSQSAFQKLQQQAASGAKVGSSSLSTSGPNKLAAGVRKRGETREEFKARMRGEKGGKKDNTEEVAENTRKTAEILEAWNA